MPRIGRLARVETNLKKEAGSHSQAPCSHTLVPTNPGLWGRIVVEPVIAVIWIGMASLRPNRNLR